MDAYDARFTKQLTT